MPERSEDEYYQCTREAKGSLYDKKHSKPECFKKGELVLKKDFTRKKRKGGNLT